jgi:hypothetical protein
MKEETTFDKLFIKLDKIIELQKEILCKIDNNSNILNFPSVFNTDCVGKDVPNPIKFDDELPFCDK